MIDEPYLADLARQIGDDGARETVELCLEDCPLRADGIRAAVTTTDPIALRAETHALAGAAHAAGMMPLAEAARALEAKAARGQVDAAAAADVLTLLHASVSAARTWLGRVPQADPATLA